MQKRIEVILTYRKRNKLTEIERKIESLNDVTKVTQE